ncbi:hypothetical protein GOP47_0009448 [Adiantum capillus-veneris]|uniref:Uncharacterized protein n=1 Tax=Adiantum capillus-veneris TaxID=13818 RepID=A0A9D4UXT4_ADICA|nr:hypothetical protein GOP47_0009448 [Adiantum capillus-veneris]
MLGVESGMLGVTVLACLSLEAFQAVLEPFERGAALLLSTFIGYMGCILLMPSLPPTHFPTFPTVYFLSLLFIVALLFLIFVRGV